MIVEGMLLACHQIGGVSGSLRPGLRLNVQAQNSQSSHAVDRPRPRHVGMIYCDVLRLDTPLPGTGRRRRPCSSHRSGCRHRAVFGLVAYAAGRVVVTEGPLANTASHLSAELGVMHGSGSRATVFISRNRLWFSGKTDLYESIENVGGMCVIGGVRGIIPSTGDLTSSR